MKLTPRNIASLKLPAGKLDHIEWDDDIAGFGLRLREGGSRTWIYRYRFGNVQRSVKLGNANSVPLATARKNASQLEAEVRLGADPQGDRTIAKQEAQRTFGLLAERFLETRKPSLRPATAIGYEYYLNVKAKTLHHLPIAAVMQADIARILNGERQHPINSNRLRSTLVAFFAWAMREGVELPRGNPAAATNKHKEASRDRVLSDKELRAVWRACADDDYGRILRLLILTGARREEMAGLRWNEVGANAIELPGARTKNGRPHTIALSEPAKAIIADVERGNREHVFGRDDTGFQAWAAAKERLDQKLGDMPPWVVHDLRRTAVTHMAELGIQPHVIEATINHVSGHKGGVAGIYNRASYAKEKREALNLWGEHVMALVEGRKAAVVSIRGRA